MERSHTFAMAKVNVSKIHRTKLLTKSILDNFIVIIYGCFIFYKSFTGLTIICKQIIVVRSFDFAQDDVFGVSLCKEL